MKVLEYLTLAPLKSITDPVLDPLQFAYRANRSTGDEVKMALNCVQSHRAVGRLGPALNDSWDAQ